jgi:hypothetical protein
VAHLINWDLGTRRTHPTKTKKMRMSHSENIKNANAFFQHYTHMTLIQLTLLVSVRGNLWHILSAFFFVLSTKNGKVFLRKQNKLAKSLLLG